MIDPTNLHKNENAGASAPPTRRARPGPPTTPGRGRDVAIEPLVVSPKEACRLMNVGMTRLYELIGVGEVESYVDGRSRKITMASIHARIARLTAAGDAGR